MFGNPTKEMESVNEREFCVNTTGNNIHSFNNHKQNKQRKETNSLMAAQQLEILFNKYSFHEQSLLIVPLYAVVCGLLQLGWQILSPTLLPNFHVLSEENRSSCYNRLVSSVHAVVMFTIAVYYWGFCNTELSFDYIKLHTAWIENFALNLMLGYLLYDCLFELMHARQMDTLVHHFFGILSHSTSLWTQNPAALYYSMMLFLAESSTPVLHAAWLLKQLNLTSSFLFTVMKLLLPLTFLFFRVALAPYLFYHIIVYAKEWGSGVVNTSLWWMNTTLMLFFLLLNFYWFYKIIQIAFVKKPRDKGDDNKKKDARKKE
jgi:hypothetical protein